MLRGKTTTTTNAKNAFPFFLFVFSIFIFRLFVSFRFVKPTTATTTTTTRRKITSAVRQLRLIRVFKYCIFVCYLLLLPHTMPHFLLLCVKVVYVRKEIKLRQQSKKYTLRFLWLLDKFYNLK